MTPLNDGYPVLEAYRSAVRNTDIDILQEAMTPAERRDLENQYTGE